MIAALALTALTLGTVKAQDGTVGKKVEATAAKGTVAADKAKLKMMKAEKKADKMAGNSDAVKEDNKKITKERADLLKDQVKKDVKTVKSKI